MTAPAPTARPMQVALLLGAAGLAAILYSSFCTVPGVQWNAPRLAPAFAIAEGLNPYATRESAAQLGWTYGPVFPLWSWPATLPGNLTASFLVWAALNLCAVAFPAWLILRELAPGRAAWVWFGALLVGNEITWTQLFTVHVDGLCVGLGLLAGWSLRRAAVQPSLRWLHLAALAMALAVWTKQVALSLLPALAGWAWAAGHRALAGRLLLWFTAYAGLLALLFFAWFGGEELLFNLWLFPSRSPWKDGAGIMSELLRLPVTGWPWLVLLAALLVWPAKAPPPAVPAGGGLGRLLVWVALFHLPLGLAASLKGAGGLNSLHSLHYALPLLAAAAADWHRRSGTRPWLGAVAAAVLLAAVGQGLRITVREHSAWTLYRGQEEALRFARENTGRAYLPWNPLVTIITERRIYPFDDALLCLHRANLAPSPAVVRAALPARPIILYPEPVQSRFALSYFPPSQP